MTSIRYLQRSFLKRRTLGITQQVCAAGSILNCKKTRTVSEAFRGCDIIPDVVCHPPKGYAKVCFPSGVRATAGNILKLKDVQQQPIVQWCFSDRYWYFLAMVDPDAPSRKNPKYREWNHWLVGNIPGGHVHRGEVLVEFFPSAPPLESGLHRYVFLVYMQPCKLIFTKKGRLNKNQLEERQNFCIRKLAKELSLGKPLAGNFYYTENKVPPSPCPKK